MYSETEKKERRKIITIIVVTVVLILALLVAIVVTATGKHKTNIGEGNNSAFMIDGENKAGETSADNEGDDASGAGSDIANLGEISTGSDTSDTDDDAPEVSSVSDLPSTGAEDLLPLALVLGAITTLATSLAMAKRER